MSSESQINHEVLTALMERHGLGAVEETVPLDSAGSTFLVNKQIVVRVNQREPDVPRLAWETLIHRRLRRATDVPCPEVIALDTRRDIVPCDVLLSHYIDGVAATTVWPKLDSVAREHISEELGRLCASAHSLHWPIFGEFLSVGQGFAQSVRWSDIVNRKIDTLYRQAEQINALPLPLLDMLVTTLNDGDALYEIPSAPTLTHTDLGLWNVLLRQDGSSWHVAGIVGWDAAIVADAAWEFASLWRDPKLLYPASDAFIYGYKERHALQDDLRVRMRLYRLLQLFECVINATRQVGSAAEQTQFFLNAIARQLHIR